MSFTKLASIAHRLTRRLARADRPETAAARQIREWTDGPNPKPERITRLAKVLAELDRQRRQQP